MTEVIFKEIVDHLYPIIDSFKEYEFDYPDYGDLPKKISNRLSPEAVDALQMTLAEIPEEKPYSKREFKRDYKDTLEYLGERVVKPNNFSFSEKDFDNLFCYATSIRESTLEFCNKEISGKEWFNIAYETDTKKVIKGMFRKFGVNGTRLKMRRLCGRFSWMGDWRD